MAYFSLGNIRQASPKMIFCPGLLLNATGLITRLPYSTFRSRARATMKAAQIPDSGQTPKLVTTVTTSPHNRPQPTPTMSRPQSRRRHPPGCALTRPGRPLLRQDDTLHPGKQWHRAQRAGSEAHLLQHLMGKGSFAQVVNVARSDVEEVDPKTENVVVSLNYVFGQPSSTRSRP
jgi:hypothetical protein